MNLSKYLGKQNQRQSLQLLLASLTHTFRQIKSGVRKASSQVCINIERETAGAVRCEDLRPDVDWAFLRGTAKPQKAA